MSGVDPGQLFGGDPHRETAARWHGAWEPAGRHLHAYATRGTIRPGIRWEILKSLDVVERGAFVGSDFDPVEEHERLLALLRHVESELAVAQAGEIGRDRGANAAAWWHQEALGGHATGDTKGTARRVLQGIEEGDPAVLDSPWAWADDYSSADLQSDCDWLEPDVDDYQAHARWKRVVPRLWDTYQASFQQAVEEEVANYCHVELAGISEVPSPDPVAPFVRPESSQGPIPDGWATEPIGTWMGNPACEVVFDPDRHQFMRVDANCSHLLNDMAAQGFELVATDQRKHLLVRDRLSQASAIMERLNRAAAPEIGGLGL